MIRKLNRIFQDYMREKRLKIGKAIWDKKDKTNIIKGNNFIKDNNIKSILFLRYDGKIGDMIVNTLMFREIKKVYPDIKIGLIARGAAIDIVKGNPNVDKIYEYHKDRKKIKELALKIKEENKDFSEEDKKLLKDKFLLSIARLDCVPKDFETLFKAYEIAKKNGYDGKLYIIRDGPDKDKVEKLKEANLYKEDILLLGRKENPYNWLKKADKLILSSRYEGFAMVLLKGLCLGKKLSLAIVKPVLKKY